jgi:hypothetical protein
MGSSISVTVKPSMVGGGDGCPGRHHRDENMWKNLWTVWITIS